MVVDAHIGHRATDAGHDAGPLVAEDRGHRGLPGRVADGQIGAAQPTARDPDQNFVGFEAGAQADVFDGERCVVARNTAAVTCTAAPYAPVSGL